VRTIPTDRRNGDVVGLVIVAEASHILLIDDIGKIIHLLPKEVRTMGRQAKGVRLIRLDSGRRLASIVAFEEEGSDVEEQEGGPVDPITEVPVETSNDETTDAPETAKPARKAKLKADGSEDDSDFMSFEGAQQDDEALYETSQKHVSPVADLLEDEDMVYFDKSTDDDDQQTMLF
jgi:DNA gyrase/topoisomerase IV subunit A